MNKSFFRVQFNNIRNLPKQMDLKLRYWNGAGLSQHYDYSVTEEPKQKKLTVDDSTILYRSTQDFDIKKFPYGSRVPQNYQPILEILKIRKRIFVKKEKSSLDLYLVAANRSLEDNENNTPTIQLKQGSFIKLGNTTIEIMKINVDKSRIQTRTSYTEIVFQDNLFTDIQQKHKIGKEYYQDSSNASTIQEAPCCRYCYQKSIDRQNLFTMLCKCQGTAKYVHEQCLKAWILQRSNYAQVKQGVYRADKQGLKCEICKVEMDIKEILPCFNDQNNQYLILLVENAQKQKSYRVINLDTKKDAVFIIGRKYECHILVNDISVSREHCCINWNHKTAALTIQDMGSKYGTLVRKNVMEITRPTYMQVGRTRFQASIEESQMFLVKKIKNLMKSKKRQHEESRVEAPQKVLLND